MNPESPPRPSNPPREETVASSLFEGAGDLEEQGSAQPKSAAGAALAPANEIQASGREHPNPLLSARRGSWRTQSARPGTSNRDIRQKDLPRPTSPLPAGENRRLSPTAASIRSGGLRGDPFDALPVASRDIVPEALDFLLVDIAAVAVPGMIEPNAFNPKVSAFLQVALQHKVAFHALIAFAQGYREVANAGATEPSAGVLYHRWQATIGLHNRLNNSETRGDNASILTAFLLTDNVWRYGEEAIGRAHYAGMMNMISIRGGLDQLGLNGILKAVIDFANATDLGDSFRPESDRRLTALTYPSLPFSAEVCSRLARLPVGFTEFALAGHLSFQTTDAILSLCEWIEGDPGLRDPAPSTQILAARRCMSALPPSKASRAERSVCLGIILTSMRMFHARFSRMDKIFIDQILDLSHQLRAERPSDEKGAIAEREHMAYLTVLAVEACDLVIELQGHIHKLVNLLVDSERFAQSWSSLEPILNKFFSLPLAIDKWRACWMKHLQSRSTNLPHRLRNTERNNSTSITPLKPSAVADKT